MGTIPKTDASAAAPLRFTASWRRRLAALCAVLLAGGCTRAYYHDYADNDSYHILRERGFDWRWRVPERPVEASPYSRMADLNDPDHVPIVPDEVAARKFQVSARFPWEYRGWKNRGTTPIEDLSWQPYVPLESDGKILLSKDSIMRIGMINSRDYQFAYENLYLSALSLTLARFQFMIQGFSNWGLFYTPLAGGGVASNSPTSSTGTTTGGSTSSGTGSTTSATAAIVGAAATTTPPPPNLNNQLQVAASNGFLLNLMSGGQLLVNLANSLVFEYSNKGVQVISPNLTVSFVQPLLRGAWARIVTQSLSLQERNVLYTLRSFAEFRRQFYVSLVTGNSGAQFGSSSGYLALLNQLQVIRNNENNLKSIRQNLAIYEAELVSGLRSALERDQLALQYQTTQTMLLSSQAGLQTTLDAFKINLGLPTEVEVRIDDSTLDQFQLNDERLDSMRKQTESLLVRLLQEGALPRPQLVRAARELLSLLGQLEKIHDGVVGELTKWQDKVVAARKQGFSGPEGAHRKEIIDREYELSSKLRQTLDATNDSIDTNQDAVSTYIAKFRAPSPSNELGGIIGGGPAAWAALQDAASLQTATQSLRDLVGKEFRTRFSEVSVAQTQIRVFSIELPPVELTVNQGIQIALGNRLDLQNALGAVTDAWRQVEVDANQLRGFLNFVYNGSFNEAPNHGGLFRFDAANSIQTFGLQFDAPINRRAERNQYRSDQIMYQRARRAYMLARDTVVQQIRLDMRNLVLLRRTFEINREQVITAARQLEEVEYSVRTPLEPGQNVTLNLLNALNGVLTARNSLIATWISYETFRMTLYRDFDLMDIDANGVWTNENDQTAIDIALRHAESSPAFSLTIPARMPDLSPGVASDSTFYIDVEPGGGATRVPDAATDPYDTDTPLKPNDFGPAPNVPAGPSAAPAPAPPGAPSPFAPARPPS
jgi:outer membrane protein TolC